MRGRKRQLAVSLTLALCAVLAISIGIARGESTEIFYKGITVCLACIGIG